MHASPTRQSSAEAVLERLNEEFIDAFIGADVARYHDHPCRRFHLHRGGWLGPRQSRVFAHVERGPRRVTRYHLEDVRIRFYDSVALVQATGRFTRADRSTGTSRYTDVYARRDRAWKVVAAQVTRATGMGSGELIGTLMAADLIDEYLLGIHPLVRGAGRRLFPENVDMSLRLANVATAGGTMIAKYERVAR